MASRIVIKPIQLLTKHKNNTSIWIVIYLALYLYIPPLIRINTMHLLTVIALFMLVFRYNEINKTDLIIKSKLIYFIGTSYFGFIFYILVSQFTSFSIRQAYIIALPLTEMVICGLFIAIYLLKNKWSITRLINMLLLLGFCQAALSIVAFLVPAIRELLVDLMVFNGYDQPDFTLKWRLMGYANSLTYAMPIVQACLAAIAFYFSINRSPKYLILVPFLLFSAIINARTSIVVFLFGSIFAVVFSFYNRKISKRSLIFIYALSIFSVLTVIAWIALTLVSSNSSFKWINDLFVDVFNLLSGEKTGTFKYIIDEGYFAIPSGKTLLTGIGYNIMVSDIGIHTDFGFLNDIWIGGIFYALIMWTAVFLLFRMNYKNDKFERYLSVLLLLTFIIANLKGMAITQNEIISLTYIIAFYLLLKNNINLKGMI